jgi:ABC-type transporter Mla subunit MlaD
MPKRYEATSWREYRVGIVVTAALAVVGSAIFLLGSTCGPFQPEVRYYHIDLDDVAGLRVGSIVRIGGIDAGEVTEIAIVPPEGAPTRPLAPGERLPRPEALEAEPDVMVALSVREPFHRRITRRSEAQLAILGAGAERYVKITAGDPREQPLPEGSEIPVVASVDWDLVLGRLSRAFNELSEITALTDEIKAKVATRRGSLGQLTEADAELYRQIGALQTEAHALMNLMDHGPGFVALYRQDRELQARVDSLNANLRLIQAALKDPNGAFQAYREPEELRVALQDLRTELAELDARMESGRGSLGRFLHDEEIFIQVRLLRERISAVAAALKEDPLAFVNIRIF